jgi:beta-glucosidase
MKHPSYRSLLTLIIALLCQPLSAGEGRSLGIFSRYDEEVQPLVARMSLEEKVGQMTQAETDSLGDLEDIRRLCLGSVLSGGDSDPKEGNTPRDWTDRHDACQSKALQTRLRIPLLYGVDAVHGHNNIAGAVIFPHNIGLGCTGNEELVEKIGRLTAGDVRATGIQWAFAPCVTVPRDVRWGRTYEGFSEDPQLVKRLGAAAVRGLQGRDLANPLRVLACAKHFVADGGTVPQRRESHHGDLDEGVRLRLDQGDARIDEQTLRKVHLAPYVDAIEAGVGSIMPSYSSWNGTKCTGSRYLLTDILKEEMGFEGFVISDFAAIEQVDPDYKTAIAKSINAGIDMGMVPYRYKEFHRLLCELVREGVVSSERIDDAVTRVLRVKAAMGLLDDSRSPLADRSLHVRFASDQHRATARQAVRESLVMLKNEGGVLPLSRDSGRIVVCGAAADDLGRQCGGWTISWQGRPGRDQLSGTTILEGLKNTAGEKVQVDYSATGDSVSGADIAVVVVGEKPYAEGLGDDFDLRLEDSDRSLIRRVAQTGTPIVVIVVSGRPMVITQEISQAEAVVAAWLPGTEGAGVADVLFGDYPSSGQLSFSWPRRTSDSYPETGSDGYRPMFPIGYGLTFKGKLPRQRLEANREPSG